MEIDLATDPWNSKRVPNLHVEDEHTKDAIAHCIDILMEARTVPDEYKTIIN
jgi:hypothetical protein